MRNAGSASTRCYSHLGDLSLSHNAVMSLWKKPPSGPSIQAEVDQPGKCNVLVGLGGRLAGPCHTSELPGYRGPDPANGLEDGPPGDQRMQAAGRDLRARERRVLGPLPARVRGLRDQPADLL
jgi:hypothetical protein